MATVDDEVSIDWATANVTDVTVTGQTLQLEVELEPEPSHFWTSAFNQSRPHRPLAIRHHWWVNAPSHRSLTVGGVEPGSEDRSTERTRGTGAYCEPAGTARTEKPTKTSNESSRRKLTLARALLER